MPNWLHINNSKIIFKGYTTNFLSFLQVFYMINKFQYDGTKKNRLNQFKIHLFLVNVWLFYRNFRLHLNKLETVTCAFCKQNKILLAWENSKSQKNVSWKQDQSRGFLFIFLELVPKIETQWTDPRNVKVSYNVLIAWNLFFVFFFVFSSKYRVHKSWFRITIFLWKKGFAYCETVTCCNLTNFLM